MANYIIHYIEKIIENPALATFLISMFPLTELRGSIPWAFVFTELPIISIYILSVTGNFLVTVPIIYFLDRFLSYISKWESGKKITSWLYIRTRRRGAQINKLKFWGLVLFVGIPLPVTGAWTGCIAANIFGIPKLKALMAILTGLILSGGIVSSLVITGKWLIFN
tara:strand:- start:10 stop:507 length:498 start_codon:yes stop_codon:yes gene_type:complete